MGSLERLFAGVVGFLPVLAALAVALVALWIADWVLLRRKAAVGEGTRFARQIAMLVLTALGIVLVVLTLPISEGTRGQLLGLLGLVLTAVIALSSTTFVANAMAGLMLRSVGSFRPGDFIRVGEQFGRVTERGLFHTEIQTEDRDLTTLPNLYLVSQPITVVRSSGTIVSANVSLGYDTPHSAIEPLLLQAAHGAELQDAFVQVLDLGNFSVTYRIAGFLPEVKHLLTVRSTLRKMVLDSLHGAGIEIVSPTFMVQRPQDEGARVVPAAAAAPAGGAEAQGPEALIFDKAEEAEKLERLREEQAGLVAEIKELEASLKEAGQGERSRLEGEIERRRSRSEAIESALASAEQPKAG